MTTLISDGKQVLSDSQTNLNGIIIDVDFQKLLRVNGVVFGFAGGMCDRLGLIDWYLQGADVENLPTHLNDEFQMVVFTPQVALLFEKVNMHGDPYNYPCAFGSGMPYALGGLMAGAGVRRSMQAALRLDPFSGGEIQSMRIK